MKLHKVTLLALFLCPFAAFAQPSSAFLRLDAARGTHEVPAIKLVKPADMLAATVSIVATSRNANEQAVAFNNALQLFRAEAAKTNGVTIERERTQQGGGEPSYLSSGKFDTNRTFAEISISYSLAGGIDSTGAAQVLRAMISRLKLPSDVDVRIDSLRVEVRDADALRETLLKSVAEDCSRIQTLFKSSLISVSGLENAVEQRPLNDREVIVYIPYTLSIGPKQ